MTVSLRYYNEMDFPQVHSLELRASDEKPVVFAHPVPLSLQFQGWKLTLAECLQAFAFFLESLVSPEQPQTSSPHVDALGRHLL